MKVRNLLAAGLLIARGGCLLAGLACVSVLLLSEGRAADPPVAVKSPLSPEESLRHFQLTGGMKIELVAAEPEVVDPVSIAFDEDGRMYVVEMRDYPTGPKPGEPPLSQIKLLEDRDNDGRYETAHVFADKLLFATGVQPWQGGVIVTLAGEIAYLKDTDGDHRADLRETWFRGFVQENPQLRANHPTFALDNHIYVANGLRGGTIVADEEKWGKKNPPVSISGKDFRFDPLTGECEAVAGNGQFGMTFDDFGNRFICDNRHPCRQVMLEDWYTKRNPFLAVREVVHDVCAPGELSRVHPLSKAWTTSTLHAGQFTAACGALMYRGDRLFGESGQHVFVCEPTGNLVHHEEIHWGRFDQPGESVAALYGRPDEGSREFLASPDEWFRPVDLANGPDGALYIVDMYRAVIEHPDWVPAELKNRPDAWLGNDRGRIYRVVQDGERAVRRSVSPKLAGVTTAELVPFLANPVGWYRDTAARLLFERQDQSAVPGLEALVDPEQDSPIHAFRALWALEGLGSLSGNVLTKAIFSTGREGSDLPRLRPIVGMFGIALLDRRLKNHPLPDDSAVAQALFSISREAGAGARDYIEFRQILALGELPDSSRKQSALARAALLGAGDDWWRRAVWTSLGDRPNLVFAEIISEFVDGGLLLDGQVFGNEKHTPIIRELAEIIGARRNPAEISPVLASLLVYRERDRREVKFPMQFIMLAGWNGLGQGLARRGDSLPAMIDQLEQREKGVRTALEPLVDDAVALSRNTGAPANLRMEAIAALQYVGFEAAGPALLELTTAKFDQSFRLRAIDVLATYRDPHIADTLLDGFTAQTPAIRRAALAALLRDPERTKRLLSEIASKHLAPTELDPLSVQALLNHKDEAIRDEAKQVLAALVPADRKKVLDEYQSALTMAADAKRGKAIFEKNCTACHRIGDLGVDVAPDIADSRTKTPVQLLTDILNPNQAIDNNYVSYLAVTTDGKSHTGVIGAETPVSITLRQPEGKTTQLLRADIEELRSSGVSLMPDGLEKNITVTQMADLISFIKNWRYLDGAVPIDTTRPAK